MFVMNGHVLHRLHLNVPGSSSVDKEPLTRELRRLLSRLNEIFECLVSNYFNHSL